MDLTRTIATLLLLQLAGLGTALAESETDRLRKDLDSERRARIELEQRLAALESARSPTSDALRREVDAYLGSLDAPCTHETHGSGEHADLLSISVVLDLRVGGSTASDEALALIALGDHDPRVRGFNIRNEELIITANVDPYFFALLDVVFKIDEEGESDFEIEEAYARSTSLPAGLELKIGQFFVEFGRTNALHPHAWEFHHQPVILGRALGGDGWRGQGARLAWRASSLPLRLLVGAQNARGETQAAFLGEGEEVGEHVQEERAVRSLADLAYHARLEAWRDIGPVGIHFGASFGRGPNGTGPSAETLLWGLDFSLQWRPVSTEAGWPFVTWQTEFVGRSFDAAAQEAAAARVYDDWGFYTQILWGFRRPWTIAFRFDHAQSDGAYPGNHERLSLALTYLAGKSTRIRLQISYDDVEALALAVPGAKDGNFSFWLGFTFSLGGHGIHRS